MALNWLNDLIHQHSVANAVLVVSLVASTGLALGRLSIFNIRLGIAGVLFSGLAFGHFGISIDIHILHFLREFGLIFFVYAIGLQVGPSFVSSFYRYGIQLNIMAVSIVLLGVLITLIVSHFGEIDMAAAIGLFSGATTNTPSLAAAQEVLNTSIGLDNERLKLPALGYAVAYPFGVVGIIVTMLLVKRFFKIDIDTEAAVFKALQKKNETHLEWRDFNVENPNLHNLCVNQIPFFDASAVVMTRILHDDTVKIASPDSRVMLGDAIRLVGDVEALQKLRILIGSDSERNLEDISKNIFSHRFVVTNKAVIGKTIRELQTYHGVTIPRIQRSADVEFAATHSTHVQFADELQVVGSQEALDEIEPLLGNSIEELDQPQIVPIFIGIALGVLLGSLPFYLPGIPSAIKLGLAGGPLIVAIILSRIASWGTMSWHLPASSNMILKDIGIVLFLACVGLYSGDKFVETLIHGDGLYWMACAIFITFLPLLIVASIGRAIYQLNFLSLCGMLAGSMTDPPALAFANNFSSSAAVSIAYATVYPLVMILRIISVQLIILFFVN